MDADMFTYSSEEELAIGTIVTISVGKKTLPGVIMQYVGKPTYDVKPITSIVEPTALPAALVSTITWMSIYYDTPLATVLQTALPRGITKNAALAPMSPLFTHAIEQKMYSLMTNPPPSTASTKQSMGRSSCTASPVLEKHSSTSSRHARLSSVAPRSSSSCQR